MQKVMLLDMDGVLCKHPIRAKYIQTKIEHYVRHKIDKHMPLKKAEKINTMLYKNFGHTLIGLQKLYDSNITLTDFCNYVYDDATIRDNLPLSENTQIYHTLIQHCQQNNIPIYIFSNAPENWCRMVLQHPYVQTIGCDHSIYTFYPTADICLKPNYITYVRLAQYINHQDTRKKNKFLYVDDTFQNLTPMLHDKAWQLIWMNNDPSTKQSIYTPQLTTIHDLEELFAYT